MKYMFSMLLSMMCHYSVIAQPSFGVKFDFGMFNEHGRFWI